MANELDEALNYIGHATLDSDGSINRHETAVGWLIDQIREQAIAHAAAAAPGTDKRFQPRWLQQEVASILGVFWLTCDLCGEKFGGHEWLPGNSRNEPGDSGRARAVCPNCGEAARSLNEAARGGNALRSKASLQQLPLSS